MTSGPSRTFSGPSARLGHNEDAPWRCSYRAGAPLSTCRCGPPTGTSIVFDMSLTYILVALVAVLLNNALVERLSLHSRITAGMPTPGRAGPHSPAPRSPGP